MPSFGSRSHEQLHTCRSELVNICENVIQHFDFTVLCGFRNMADQNEAFATGRSKLQYPESRHNKNPSYAVDVAPWHVGYPHIRWDAEREFFFLAGLMTQAARSIGVTLRWGGNWDMDDDLYDRNVPFDLVHFEIFGG
jgi:peptidoglycan L-alanyl-D-glutamate endopeptidase CwlK